MISPLEFKGQEHLSKLNFQQRILSGISFFETIIIISSFFSPSSLRLQDIYLIFRIMKKIMLVIFLFTNVMMAAEISTIFRNEKVQGSFQTNTAYLIYLSKRLCGEKIFEKAKTNYTLSSRLFTVESEARKIVMILSKEDIASQSRNSGALMLLLSVFVGLAFLIIRTYFRTVLDFKKYLSKAAFNATNQFKINKSLHICLTVSLITTTIYALKGIQAAVQSKDAVTDTICSILVGNNNLTQHNILVIQGHGRTSFQTDSLYYQMRLLSIRQTSAQLLNASSFNKYKMGIQITKQIINSTVLSMLEDQNSKLEKNLIKLIYQTAMVQSFICYMRDKIQNSRSQMINYFRLVDEYLGRIEQLPGVLSQWFANIFIILFLGNILFVVGNIRLIKKNDKYGRSILSVGANLLSFFIFVSLISLSTLFVAENMIYLNCLKTHDYQKRELFEYYFNKKEKSDDAAFREFMMKLSGHSLPNLQTVYGYDVQKLSQTSINSINSIKRIYYSQKLKQASRQFNNINNKEDVQSFTLNFNKTIEYLSDLQNNLVNIFELSHFSKAQTILKYSFTEISGYRDNLEGQICGKDLNLIMKINNFLLICIIGALSQLNFLSKLLQKNQNSFIEISSEVKGEQPSKEITDLSNHQIASQSIQRFQQSQNKRMFSQ